MLFLKIFITVLVAIVAFSKVDSSLVIKNLQSISKDWFLLSILVLYGHLMCHLFRWFFLVKALKIEISTLEVFKLLSIALFINQVTPASVGADGLGFTL